MNPQPTLSERAITSGVLNTNSGLTQTWVQILILHIRAVCLRWASGLTQLQPPCKKWLIILFSEGLREDPSDIIYKASGVSGSYMSEGQASPQGSPLSSRADSGCRGPPLGPGELFSPREGELRGDDTEQPTQHFAI